MWYLTQILVLCATTTLADAAQPFIPASQPSTQNAPATVLPAQELKLYADSADRVNQAAASAANLYLQAAQARCRQALSATPEYKAVADQLAANLRKLSDPASLKPEVRSAVTTDIEAVKKSLAELEAAALAADPDVRAANVMVARLAPASQPVGVSGAVPLRLARAPIAITSQPAASAVPLQLTGTSAPALPAPGVTFSRPIDGTVAQRMTTPTQPTKLSGLEIGQLIHDGWNNIVARNYGDAMALFMQVDQADTRDLTVLTGRGICEYELKDYKAAEKDLDKAYSLATSGGSRPSRQLYVAYAAGEVMNGNPMRGVRVVEDLSQPAVRLGKVDEELQNDLGIAMTHADAQAHMGDLYHDALKYYTDCDKLLNEKRQDGKARWGVTWIDAALAAQKWQAYRQAVANADQASFTFRRAQSAMTVANDHYHEIMGGLRLHGTVEIETYTQEWHQAIANVRAAETRLNHANNALQTIEAPPFPDRIQYDWQEPK